MSLHPDHLEFLMHRHLDGDLTPAERAELERALAADPAARRQLEQLEELERQLARRPVPAVAWDRLATSIGRAAARQAAVGDVPMGPRLAADDAVERAAIASLAGELSRNEQAEFDARLTEDGAARRVLAQQRALSAVLEHALPLPDFDAAALRQRIVAAAVAQRPAATVGSEVDEQTEQDILAAVDGDLPLAREAGLETARATDPAIAETWRQHASLRVWLDHALPLPYVDWPRLAERIGQAVEAQRQTAARALQFRARLRTVARVAAAACVVLAAMLAVQLLGPGRAPDAPSAPAAPRQILAIDTPRPDTAGPRVIHVAIGPSERIAQGFNTYATGAVVSFQPRIQIAELPRPAGPAGDVAFPY
jgi:anti-sigma factor RsiW